MFSMGFSISRAVKPIPRYGLSYQSIVLLHFVTTFMVRFDHSPCKGIYKHMHTFFHASFMFRKRNFEHGRVQIVISLLWIRTMMMIILIAATDSSLAGQDLCNTAGKWESQTRIRIVALIYLSLICHPSLETASIKI